MVYFQDIVTHSILPTLYLPTYLPSNRIQRFNIIMPRRDLGHNSEPFDILSPYFTAIHFIIILLPHSVVLTVSVCQF